MKIDDKFPPPWRIEENRDSYVIRDRLGQPLAYIYFENEPIRRDATKRMMKDDAWQLARAITRILPLLQQD